MALPLKVPRTYPCCCCCPDVPSPGATPAPKDRPPTFSLTHSAHLRVPLTSSTAFSGSPQSKGAASRTLLHLAQAHPASFAPGRPVPLPVPGALLHLSRFPLQPSRPTISLSTLSGPTQGPLPSGSPPWLIPPHGLEPCRLASCSSASRERVMSLARVSTVPCRQPGHPLPTLPPSSPDPQPAGSCFGITTDPGALPALLKLSDWGPLALTHSSCTALLTLALDTAPQGCTQSARSRREGAWRGHPGSPRQRVGRVGGDAFQGGV